MNTPRKSAVSGWPPATLLPRWPQRDIGHPLWLAALIVLLINDHLLKGAHVVPGWLTGKLSDFAGLIVAPVLLATVIRARRASARFACIAAVGVGFAAVKLVPAAARGLEAALGLAHFPSRIWSDPTDLCALAVLPLAWWLTGQPRSAHQTPGRAQRIYHAAAMLVSALACVASDGVRPATFDPPRPSADVELENRTGRSLLLTVYYNNYDASVDCAAVLAGDFSSLLPKQFDSGTLCSQFEDGAISSFGSIDLSPPPDAGFHPMCKSLAIRAPGLPDTILIWPTQTAQSTNPDQGHLYLDTSGNGLVITGTDYVQSIPPPFPLPAPTCDAGS